MKAFYNKYIYPHLTKLLFVLLTLLLLLTAYYWQRGEAQRAKDIALAEQEMQLPDTLQVACNTGAMTYFLYKEEPMGYEYELLKLFSRAIKRPFQLHLVESLDSIHTLIKSGQIDLCIRPEAMSQEAELDYSFVGLEQESAIVLVQRRRKSHRDTMYVSKVPELLNRKVYVEEGSRYAQRVEHLAEQLGGRIDFQYPADSLASAEELIDLVAKHSIDYALVDEHLALLAKTYYPNVDVSLKVAFPQKLKWICNRERKGLAIALDQWADSLTNVEDYKNIYRKYFIQEREEDFLNRAERYDWRGEYDHIHDGRLSPYDEIFRKEAKRLGWPWQILASIAYQESNFKARIIGWSGARGLMGIMPRTGRIFGANKAELLDPQIAVRVSVDCLLATQKMFRSIKNPEERIKFTLAGYNAGGAHVQDAQRLAKKYDGGIDSLWDNHVERFILLKRKARYYKDPVCKYGYLRGQETFNYVREVMARYKLYKEKVK